MLLLVLIHNCKEYFKLSIPFPVTYSVVISAFAYPKIRSNMIYDITLLSLSYSPQGYPPNTFSLKSAMFKSNP